MVEGYNISDLNWGTSDAQSVTLSFWVRSSVTGTLGGSVANGDFNRFNPFSYTISSANTWEYKTVTIAGDTSGTWYTNNGIGIRLNFSLGAGSAKLGTAGTWTSSTKEGVTGQVNPIQTNGSTFYITGVQLEAGGSASNFEYLQYGQQYANCQRYYQTLLDCNQSYVNAGMHVGGRLQFNTEMRANPTTTATVDTSANVDNSYTFYRVRTNSLGYYQSASAAGNFFWYTDFVMDSEL
jgi:dipeptidyl aminopeptidase/acylaminoacyl peptidase